MRALGQEVPVNIRFCLEGMEESGSQGLEELLKARKVFVVFSAKENFKKVKKWYHITFIAGHGFYP